MCRAVVAAKIGGHGYAVTYQSTCVSFSHSSLLKSEKENCSSVSELGFHRAIITHIWGAEEARVSE